MMPLPAAWIAAAALAAGAAGGYWAASKVGAGKTAQAEARRMQCEQTRAEEARAAAEKSAALLARAQDAEAAAAARLAAWRAAHEKTLQETRRDLYRLTTGRECLSGPVRLRLNAAIAAGGLPASPGAADPAAAAPAADSGELAATDGDVAGWALDAARQYGECLARIDAIRQWDDVINGR